MCRLAEPTWACGLLRALCLVCAAQALDVEDGTCAAGTCATVHQGVRDAVQAYFDALHSSQEDAFGKMWHPSGELALTSDGKVTVLDSETFRARVVKRAPSTTEDYVKHDTVLFMRVLDERTAVAKVKIVLPAAEPMHFVDFLVFLRDEGGWRIISKVFTGRPLAQARLAAQSPRPEDFSAVADAVWHGYVAASRAGDAERLAQIFHPSARSTFATDEGKVRAVGAADFAALAKGRWALPRHKPYAHLRDDARAAAADELLGVEFASPDLALATVRVGFPPFVYTDVLSMARLEGRWWIVARTSTQEPFLAEERLGEKEA